MNDDNAEGKSSNPGLVCLVLIATILTVAVVTYLGPILKPFLVGIFLYFATRAAAGTLIRRRFPPLLAHLTLFVGGSAVVAGLFVMAYGEALSFRAEWPRYQQRVLEQFDRLGGDARHSLSDLFTQSSREVFQYVFERSVDLIDLLVMTFFYLLFILLGASRLPQRVRRAFPGKRGEHILFVADKIGTGMEKFMEVKTLVSLGMGVSAALLMYFFGLRGWLLWGLLFFVFNFITYIGSFAACIPPAILAFVDLESPATAAILVILLVLNRFLWVDYVEIKVSGRHLNIESVVLFLWLAYWGWMWGVAGLVLAFPMVNSLKILLENLEATRGWAVLMSDD
jgi:predicted PurR-regulated permease PerM